MRVTAGDSRGSGFVVDSDGYILTNAHVVYGEHAAVVIFENGLRIMADIIGLDATADVALLKIPPDSDLVVLRLATRISEGEDVFALGYPLDYLDSITITKGIVSALRSIGGIDYVQTDAAINPGNSGGPLLNITGEVVGMNSLAHRDIAGEEYSAQGIGFAVGAGVLSNRLKTLVDDAIPTPSPNETPEPTPRLLFGPFDGRIEHVEPIDVYKAGVSLEDVIVEASFYNPYGPETGEWSYGIFIRHASSDVFHAIVIKDEGDWEHYTRRSEDDIDSAPIARSSSNLINTHGGGHNAIRVVATGATGELHINGIFVTTLDLSGLRARGTVAVFANYFTGDGTRATSTRFTGFTVWAVR